MSVGFEYEYYVYLNVNAHITQFQFKEGRKFFPFFLFKVLQIRKELLNLIHNLKAKQL